MLSESSAAGWGLLQACCIPASGRLRHGHGCWAADANGPALGGLVWGANGTVSG